MMRLSFFSWFSGDPTAETVPVVRTDAQTSTQIYRDGVKSPVEFVHGVYYDNAFRDLTGQPMEWWVFDDTMEYLCALSTSLNASLKCITPTNDNHAPMVHELTWNGLEKPLDIEYHVESEWHPRYGWRCVGFKGLIRRGLGSERKELPWTTLKTLRHVWGQLRTFPGYDRYRSLGG